MFEVYFPSFVALRMRDQPALNRRWQGRDEMRHRLLYPSFIMSILLILSGPLLFMTRQDEQD